MVGDGEIDWINVRAGLGAAWADYMRLGARPDGSDVKAFFARVDDLLAGMSIGPKVSAVDPADARAIRRWSIEALLLRYSSGPIGDVIDTADRIAAYVLTGSQGAGGAAKEPYNWTP